MHILHYKTSQEAWHGLNESFIDEFRSHPPLKYQLSGSEITLNDVLIKIDKPYINPEFDFGNLCDYKMQKWVSLVKNYLSKDELLILKKKIETRESKKQNKYTESLLFSNSHKNGKGCLLSITFNKRKEERILSCVIRSSEITKRLLLDLLLIQKIGNYIYGTKTPFKIHIICYNMYQIAEFATTYDLIKPIESFISEFPKEAKYTEKVLSRLSYFKTVDINTVKFKVYKRSIRTLQVDSSGKPLSGTKGLKVKDLKFTKHLS